jgi:hypothetical protein
MFPWDVTSVYYRQAIPWLFLIAIFVGYRRIGTPVNPLPKWQRIMNTVINLVLIVFFGVLSGFALKGYPPPDGSIALVSPLRDGAFVVGHGGSSPFINGHAKVRPQNHALDILGLNAWGSRFKLFGDMTDFENYAIFSSPLYAPCAGEVLIAVDGLEDLVPPATDRENLAGNHVVIGCFGAEVVLAHMQKGSVAVSVGDVVDTDTLLGRVGNSGNTSEPHLHIHAERGGEAGQILNGEAVPITIDGRYLVRGDIIKK